MEFPNNLWHAAQFYLTGRVVHDHLIERGISYELTIDVRNIFSCYNTPEFRSILENYYQSSVDMDGTIKRLLLSNK